MAYECNARRQHHRQSPTQQIPTIAPRNTPLTKTTKHHRQFPTQNNTNIKPPPTPNPQTQQTHHHHQSYPHEKKDLDAFRYRKTSHLVNLLLAADDLRETLEGKESEDEDEEGAAGESDRLILGALVDGDEGDGGNGQAAGKGRNDKGAAAPAAASAVAVGAGVGNKKEAQEQERRPPRIRSLPEAVAKVGGFEVGVWGLAMLFVCGACFDSMYVNTPTTQRQLDSIINSPPLYSKAVIFACHLVSAFAGALVFWRGDWLVCTCAHACACVCMSEMEGGVTGWLTDLWFSRTTQQDAAVAAVATVFVALVVVPGSDQLSSYTLVSRLRITRSALDPHDETRLSHTHTRIPHAPIYTCNPRL